MQKNPEHIHQKNKKQNLKREEKRDKQGRKWRSPRKDATLKSGDLTILKWPTAVDEISEKNMISILP